MARKAALFEDSGGAPLRGYLLMKASGSANIPPSWIQRAHQSRKKREAVVSKLLKRGKPSDIVSLEEWELAFRKESFYRGIRILLDLERLGKSKL